MFRFELRDVGISPRFEPARVLRTLELATDRRVGVGYTLSDGKGDQAAQSFEHITLWMGLELLEQFGDMPRFHHSKALIPVFGAEPLEQRAPHPLCGQRKPGE